jgi:hypothetical protein
MVRKYKSSPGELLTIYIGYILFVSVIGWFSTYEIQRILKIWAFAIPALALIIILIAFFTYLKIDELNKQVTAVSTLFSVSRASIFDITHIQKQPHPILKGLSWSIAVYYREKDRERKFEIWPSFSPETIGRFLADLRQLNPDIQFDKECEEWMEKAQKA